MLVYISRYAKRVRSVAYSVSTGSTSVVGVVVGAVSTGSLSRSHPMMPLRGATVSVASNSPEKNRFVISVLTLVSRVER